MTISAESPSRSPFPVGGAAMLLVTSSRGSTRLFQSTMFQKTAGGQVYHVSVVPGDGITISNASALCFFYHISSKKLEAHGFETVISLYDIIQGATLATASFRQQATEGDVRPRMKHA